MLSMAVLRSESRPIKRMIFIFPHSEMVNIIETHSRDNQLLLADYKLNIELQALD